MCVEITLQQWNHKLSVSPLWDKRFNFINKMSSSLFWLFFSLLLLITHYDPFGTTAGISGVTISYQNPKNLPKLCSDHWSIPTPVNWKKHCWPSDTSIHKQSRVNKHWATLYSTKKEYSSESVTDKERKDIKIKIITYIF